MLIKLIKTAVRARIKDGRTLRSIARESRISAPHLCRWLQGKSSLGQAAIDRLATGTCGWVAVDLDNRD